MAMVSEEGTLRIQSETICFDRDLAIAMADDDSDHCTWVGVYALDADGRSLQNGAVYSNGSLDGFRTGRTYRQRGAEAGVGIA